MFRYDGDAEIEARRDGAWDGDAADAGGGEGGEDGETGEKEGLGMHGGWLCGDGSKLMGLMVFEI